VRHQILQVHRADATPASALYAWDLLVAMQLECTGQVQLPWFKSARREVLVAMQLECTGQVQPFAWTVWRRRRGCSNVVEVHRADATRSSQSCTMVFFHGIFAGRPASDSFQTPVKSGC
jgi:hypothetical protein